MQVTHSISFLAVLLLTIHSSTAQNVPNGDFENWETENHYVLDDWVSYGRPQQSTDAASGSFALKLTNWLSADGAYYSSSIYNVDWQNGGIDKFPYEGNPLSMVFEAKYALHPGDSADFVSGFYEKGIWIGEARIKVTGTSNNNYETYSVPITWYTSSRTPDSVFVGVRTLSHSDRASGPGFIILDDFRYENIGDRTQEIVNHDFENWSNKGVRYPKGWLPIDLLSYREWGGFLLNKSVVQNTQPFRDESCLAIQNFQSWNEEIGKGLCFTGDTSPHAWSPSFPIDQKYTYLQGYYRLENGDNDTAEISLNVFREGNYLGEGKLLLGGNQPQWTFFSIPIRYYTDAQPDSATIRLRSSLESDVGHPSTVFYIDNLELVNELKNTVGTDKTGHLPIAVYPNPATSYIHIESADGICTLTDMQGKVLVSEALQAKHKINITNLSTGIYKLTIINKDKQVWHKKIIKK